MFSDLKCIRHFSDLIVMTSDEDLDEDLPADRFQLDAFDDALPEHEKAAGRIGRLSQVA